MYFGEGHNLFLRLFYGFGPIVPAIFMFICVGILGEFFYFFKMRKEEGSKSGVKYFIWRIIFYFYLMMVYIQTGIRGAFWWIPMSIIRSDRIYLIPFTTSSDVVPYLFNILMLMPLGFLLPFVWPGLRSLKRVVISAFLLSVGIEFIQLFSFRVSSTSDLITNTTGAMFGYGIFCVIDKLLSKNLEKKDLQNSSKLIRNEGAIYLCLSFVGIVFLHHPTISRTLPQIGGHEEIMAIYDGTITESGHFIPDDLEIPDNMDIEEIQEVLGSVQEVLDDRIVIQRFHQEMLEGGGEMLVSMPEEDAEEIEIFFTEEIIISIYSGSWQNPTIVIGNIDDIEFDDSLTMYGYFNEDGEFVAIEIKIMRV